MQAAVLSIPGQIPSLQRGHWKSGDPASGGTSSVFAFTLPEIEGIPGPHENALYWVSSFDLEEACELFWCRDRYGLVFMSVVWTEPYPQSEARALDLENDLIAVRQRVLAGWGSTLQTPPGCRRSLQGGFMVTENACDPGVQAGNDSGERR